MAIDNTPPRLRLIATIAVIVVITLVGLDFVLKGYYAYMSDQAVREKLAPLTARDEQRVAEQTAMAGAKVPIDQAMKQLATARGDLVNPTPSEDMGPMTGWSKMPKQPPLPAPGGGAHPLPGAPGMMGTMDMGTDAGAATPHMAADAAAPHAPAPHAPAVKDAGARAPH